jgi:hypothetical protein
MCKFIKVEEIKKHEFFAGIDWDNLYSKPAPFIPEYNLNCKTKNFEERNERFIIIILFFFHKYFFVYSLFIYYYLIFDI